jgi:hypothetical protein
MLLQRANPRFGARRRAHRRAVEAAGFGPHLLGASMSRLMVRRNRSIASSRVRTSRIV